MDELQDQLVRVGLAVVAKHGFVLAGGYALQAHGLTDRMSEDVDLFTDRWDTGAFRGAVETVVEAYRREGLNVAVAQHAETFARLEVTDAATGRAGSVDLAADIRGDQPVALSIGPVLAESDAVASKVAAVFSRGYARDYLDLAGILASGRYSRDGLVAMARNVDAGFTTDWFAEALAGVDRFSDEDFSRYGVSAEQIAIVRQTMRVWSVELTETPTTAPQRDGPRASRAGRPPLGPNAGERTPPRAPGVASQAIPDPDYHPPGREGPTL